MFANRLDRARRGGVRLWGLILVLAPGGAGSLVAAGCSSGAPQRIDERRAMAFERGALERKPLVQSEPLAPRGRGEQLVPPATLAGYLELGLRHSSRLAAAFERFAATLEAEALATGLPNPRLGWSEFIERLETRAGPQRRRLSVSQSVPFPGVLGALGDRAEAATRMAWVEFERVRLELFGEIERAFAEYAYLGERLQTAESQLELLQSLEPIVQGRLRGGADQSDLLTLQVEVGRLQNTAASARGALAAASARLEALIEWRGTSPLPVPPQAEPRELQLDRRALLESALSAAPALMAARASHAHSESELRVATAQRWPALDVGVELADTGEALAGGTPDSGDDALSVRLSFGVPLWVGRDAARIRSARHGKSAAAAELDGQRARLVAEIERLAFRLEDAQRQIELYREELLPRARQVRELLIAAYRGGEATALQLLDAERVELELADGLARALRDHVDARTHLEFEIGAEL